MASIKNPTKNTRQVLWSCGLSLNIHFNLNSKGVTAVPLLALVTVNLTHWTISKTLKGPLASQEAGWLCLSQLDAVRVPSSARVSWKIGGCRILVNKDVLIHF